MQNSEKNVTNVSNVNTGNDVAAKKKKKEGNVVGGDPAAMTVYISGELGTMFVAFNMAGIPLQTEVSFVDTTVVDGTTGYIIAEDVTPVN